MGDKKRFTASQTTAATTAITTTTTNNSRCSRKESFFLLPYKREIGKHLIKSMKRRISKLLPPEIKTQVAYTAK